MRAVPKTGMRKRSAIIEMLIDIFRGMNTIIHKAKIPVYLFTKLINWELSQQLNSIRKRTGYATLLNSGLTTVKSIYEFLNSNGDRLLVIQDGTSIKESVYSGGYGAVGAISNDKRYGTPNVTQMYPVEENNVLRSGAGIGNSADVPFVYLYISDRNWFNDLYTSIADGKYLMNQEPKVSNQVGIQLSGQETFEVGSGTSGGNTAGSFVVFFSPVYDGKQRGFPEIFYSVNFTVTNGKSLKFIISGYTSGLSNLLKDQRLTAIDVFIAHQDSDVHYDSDGNNAALFSLNAYFVERVDMNSDGDTILDQPGTLETAAPPTYIQFDNDAADWETFDLQNFYAIFSTVNGDYEIKLGARDFTATPKVRYAVSGLDNADSGLSVASIKIFPRWWSVGGGQYSRAFVFDNFYRLMGSEMYAYLNIPQGDTGITDFRYKFSCICNNRYFIFGTPDGFGYFSKENNYDVIPSLNILRPLKDETGCFSINYDVFVGYKDTFSRFTVLSNENADKDHRVFDFGLTSQKGWAKIDEGNIAVNSYKGPYLVTGRNSAYIGGSIQTWFKKTGSMPYLTQAQIATGTVSYNHLGDKVIFSYPDYTSSDFPNGISFVFDFIAHRAGFEAWYIMRSDKKLKSTCLADDLHLLSSGGTEIQDWNNASPTESFSTEIGFKLLRQSKKRHKINWKKIFIQATSDDTFTAKLYFDGSASSTDITISSTTLEGIINYIKTTLEVVITTPASTNAGEISEITITNVPRMR